MSHWTYPLIKNKLIMLSEDKGFKFTEQDNWYRSQRCGQCGWTHKSNRKGKTFKCTNAVCDYIADSDLNAASNHEVELIEVPHSIKVQKLNHTVGFFWLCDKIICGQECIVPVVPRE